MRWSLFGGVTKWGVDKPTVISLKHLQNGDKWRILWSGESNSEFVESTVNMEIEKDDSGGEDNSELERSIVNMEMEKDDSELQRSIVNMEMEDDDSELKRSIVNMETGSGDSKEKEPTFAGKIKTLPHCVLFT